MSPLAQLLVDRVDDSRGLSWQLIFRQSIVHDRLSPLVEIVVACADVVGQLTLAEAKYITMSSLCAARKRLADP